VRTCPTCDQQTPDGRFCVRCGAPLEAGLTHARHRSEFAAAPGEHRLSPRLVSTLFPHLTHHSMRHFRIALAAGLAVLIALGAARLFPVALITAALLMPLLTGLYFYDVDVYEGEPLFASAWTFAWGAASGVGVGILAKAVAPHGAALIDKGSTAHTVTGGVLLPALGVVLMLAGPLVLLRYRRFNEILDGTTFGAACAAAFAAAQAVVVGVDVLGGGLRPAGAAAPWVSRLVSLGIATPVLSMAAIGAACAALWCRYRAPATDRGALGLLGHPLIAVPLAAALVIAGAVGETFMAAGAWLASLVVLDLLAVILLRRAIHVGLLEESAEIEIGPEITCANCGAQTATHTFCGSCGIALQALPKDRGDAARGGAHGRLAPGLAHRRLLIAGLALGAAVAVGVAVGALAAPATRRPACRRGMECGSPPILPRAVFAFPGYSLWQSSGLGFALRYNSSDWQLASQDAQSVELQTSDGSSLLIIVGRPSTQATPAELLNHELTALQGQLLGLARDTDPSDALLGANVGLRPGPGGVYDATITSPQAPQTPVSIAMMAASDGRVSIAAVVIAPANDQHEKAAVYQRADDTIASVEWAGS
jgi:hypothetical protein